MQRSRTRAVIPGKRILGVAGAEKAQKATMGGAVVPGARILGDKAAREQEQARLARLGVAAVDPKAATGPAPKPAVSALDASLPPNKTAKTKTAQAKRVDPSYTEGEAVTMLEADPNAWAKVLDLESERPDGVRPAIAAAIVKYGAAATNPPLHAEAVTVLTAIADQAKE